MAHSKSLNSNISGWKWQIPEYVGNEKLVKIVSAINQTHVYIERTISGIDDKTLWLKPRSNMPSAANLLLHMAGTEHEWIGNKIGGIKLDRNRDFEFDADEESAMTKADICKKLIGIWDQTRSVMLALHGDEKRINDSALFCLHYTENHLAYHVGQLVFVVKFNSGSFRLY